MELIPDAYEDALKHLEKQPCKSEILEQWTMQKTAQRLQKNLNVNVSCCFWNYDYPLREKAYSVD